MTEKDLIRKIQTLKKIEPRKDWVLLTKSRILEPSTTFSEPSFGSIFWSIFSQKKWWGVKPAFVIPVALLLIGGAIFYFSNLGDLRLAQVQYEQELVQLQNLNLSFQNLQANISQVKENLERAEVKNPKTVLEIGKSIDSTVRTGKKMFAETKKIVEATSSEKIAREPEEQVLASVADTEKALEELENSYQQKVKGTVEHLIKEIEHWSLGEIDQQRFEEAKEAYQNGNYNQALEKILFLGY